MRDKSETIYNLNIIDNSSESITTAPSRNNEVFHLIKSSEDRHEVDRVIIPAERVILRAQTTSPSPAYTHLRAFMILKHG